MNEILLTERELSIAMSDMSELGISSIKLYDAGLLFVAYALGVTLLYMGYRCGGRTWVRRHGLVWTRKNNKKLISGFWPELTLFTACTILVLVVDLSIADVSLVTLIREDGLLTLVLFLFVFSTVAAYSYHTVRQAYGDPHETKGDCRRLIGAYRVYCPYTTILFTGGMLVVYLLIRQFMIDQVRFEVQADLVRGLVGEARRFHDLHLQSAATDPILSRQTYATALANVESAFGGVGIATNQLQDQMNPIFIFASAIFSINILIRFTAIKNAFLDGARNLTHISTAVAICFAALFGFYIYFWSYGLLLDDTIDQLSGMGPDPSLGAWEMTRRFNELFISLNKSKNIFGFASAMGGQGSALATFIFGVQFTLGRIQSNDLTKAERAANILPYSEWRNARRINGSTVKYKISR